jgi:hypothetical protein
MNTYIIEGIDIIGSQLAYRPPVDSYHVKLLCRMNYHREGIFSE